MPAFGAYYIRAAKAAFSDERGEDMSRDINALHPELAGICRLFLKRCEENGLRAGIAQTFRTKEEQESLYAMGRTVAGSIVTNARYPLSPHCWGLAFDIYRNDGKGAYNDEGGWFSKCGQIGKAMGLFWGGDFKTFKDKPHFELAKYLPGNSCKDLIDKYKTPSEFIKTWSDTVTQQQFNEMMGNYLAGLDKKAASGWAKDLLSQAVSAGISDGKRPGAWATREEVAIMIQRALSAK